MENGWVRLCLQLFYKSVDEELQACFEAVNCLLLLPVWLVGCERDEGEGMWKFRKGFQPIIFFSQALKDVEKENIFSHFLLVHTKLTLEVLLVSGFLQ